MIYFQLINTVTMYGGEIQAFTEGKNDFNIERQTYASIFYCAVGIIISIIVGKQLDKYKCYKFMINLVSVTILLGIVLT